MTLFAEKKKDEGLNFPPAIIEGHMDCMTSSHGVPPLIVVDGPPEFKARFPRVAWPAFQALTFRAGPARMLDSNEHLDVVRQLYRYR